VVAFFSISALCYAETPGQSGNPAIFLPTLILVLIIISASSGGKSGAFNPTFGSSA